MKKKKTIVRLSWNRIGDGTFRLFR